MDKDDDVDRPSTATDNPETVHPPGRRVPAPAGLIRARALLLPLPLIMLNALWIVHGERIGIGPKFTTISLFANVFFILTVLIAINGLFRRFVPAFSLTRAELLLAYSMLAVASAIGGQDTLAGLIQMMGHPFRFDTPANAFLDRFGQYLPMQLMVSDERALAGYYQGHSSLYRTENWTAWLIPVVLWSAFMIALFWTMMCANVLLRQQWQDRERLPFPIVEIPLQMTDTSGALWRNRLFWVALVIFGGIEVLNGLNWLYPTIPGVPVQHVNVLGTGIFSTRPWNAVGFTTYSFYPFVIGLGYLLPLDLLLSCWVFYFFWKAQLVLSATMAWDVTPDFPFVREQGFGAYMAIVAFMLYNARGYFREMWKRICREPSPLDDRNEGMSYRNAFIGIICGFLFLVGFFVWAGMSPVLAVAAFLIYLAISVAVARIRAELGPPVHDLHFTGPDYLLPQGFGTTSFQPRDLTMLSFFFSFTRAYRSHPMPHGVEGLKAAKDVGANQKIVFWGLMLAAGFGVFAAFGAYLHLAYELGVQAQWRAGSNFGGEAYRRLNTWIQSPTPPNPAANMAILAGGGFASLLMILRMKLAWWPFHAIGYAISGSWAMNLVWMPLFIAWVVKACILRYGGVHLYRQAMPFFLGMLLGPMIVGCLWHLLGLAMGIVPYSFWGQ